RAGIAALVDRRLVAPQALNRFLARGPKDLTADVACRRAAERLRDVFTSIKAPGGLQAFLADGPRQHAQFAMLAADIRQVADAGLQPSATSEGERTTVAQGFSPANGTHAGFRNFIDRLRAYFLTQGGEPRGKNFTGTIFKAVDCRTDDA